MKVETTFNLKEIEFLTCMLEMVYYHLNGRLTEEEQIKLNKMQEELKFLLLMRSRK